MKRLLASVALCALPISAIIAPPVSAQLAVYDPANHVQNVYQAVRALQQVDQQIQQLTHEIAMLENMARDLENLPDSIASDILSRMQRIDDLMRDAEGIGYKVEEIERAYEEAYPEDYGDTPPENAVLVEQAHSRWKQSRTAYRESLAVTAQVIASAREDASSLGRLIAGSQSAVGNLQVLQAGNQIEALQTEQLMQMESMMAAHYRAEALERSRNLAEAERGRARTKSFLEN
ncbi:MAG TPA: P-type conjugative transfer protein TrbJ [Hyphomonas sp.]|uniref:P-type conjugative transfer protein TrbJ n=1 Tax=Hyphomonas sp. UBA5107 TaxID=1946636 RepID=UPI000C564425|nr:P-type conjugative transfer protein TrbJ [Hyphomonas sp. UBA5107]MAA94104.1 P-type conjugative transfer protein TrbJ [Rheinheimera sp.]MAN65870.1 P-type conjugative transfer protein TrbJ [Hyphomonadaceae bacterium]HBL92133.1 P-type conjugative transfer protein TrbJ [Hyphomonas sp.]HCJ17682.1 P-type conjugative transfer protein TrbJ [Hyphomonas sp.]HCN93053.1 P-type conjugative transfer protein TrbJ [Hyphomonas sp.]|tara:strand:+ start:425 stop:1123 length:699 start_codon:yes stop_codon:yes gene_type:complete